VWESTGVELTEALRLALLVVAVAAQLLDLRKPAEAGT
jgi:hypothetical protein